MDGGTECLRLYHRFLFCLTFKIGDVFVARISETEGFAGLQKCGGEKTAQRAFQRLARARLRFSEPRADRKGGVALIVC